MTTHDVAIIGLGISGLRVAYQLEEHGLDWVGLEAQPRVGGRTEQLSVAGSFRWESGGEFLKPGQAVVRAVLSELGIGTIPMERLGLHVHLDRGSRRVEQAPFDWDPCLRDRYVATKSRLDQLARGLGSDIRVESQAMQGTDDLTVAQWLEGAAVQQAVARRIGRDLTFGMAGTPETVSLLAALAYHRSAELGSAHGHGEERIDGGGSAIVDALRARLPQARIRLREAANRIDWDGRAATLTTSTGSLRARRICLALSPVLARRIQIAYRASPGFDELRTRWIQSHGLKSALFYPTAWWRDRGLSGVAEGDLTVSYLIDTSPADGTYGMLTLLMNEDARRATSARHSPAQLRTSFEMDVATYLGEAREPSLAFSHRAWREFSFSPGCGSPLPPGAMTAVRPAWGRPDGPIVWAGTESARVGWGSIEGALSAAHDAVRQLTDPVG